MSESLSRPYTYEWYGVIEGSATLQQGDLFPSVPVPHLISPEDAEMGTDPKSFIRDFDLIVMSQSCDLEHCKTEMILFCPYTTLSSYIEDNLAGKKNEEKLSEMEKLRKGLKIGYHLLNCCDLPSFESDYLVVDLKNPISLPVEYIAAILPRYPRRVRLLPPFREQLSQSFSLAYMRIGLPTDIPPFKRLPPNHRPPTTAEIR